MRYFGVASAALLLFFGIPSKTQTLPAGASTRPTRLVHPRVVSQQEILLLFGGLSTDNRILLMLNNNRSAETIASVTAFTADGVSYALPDITLVSRESRLIDLGPTLIAHGMQKLPLGYLKVAYSGILMEVGAQLTLYPLNSGTAVDSPRSLSIDAKTTNRSTTFTVPSSGKVRLALTNSSTGPIIGSLRCGLESQPVFIPEHVTFLEDVPPITTLGQEHSAGSCDLSYQGDPADLRAFGFVYNSTYAAPLRFYDPSTATSSNLTAVALRTNTQTAVTLHNTTGSTVDVQPTLRQVTQTAPVTKLLNPVTLAPYATTIIDVQAQLSELSASSIELANFGIETSAQPGALIGSLTQTDTNGIVEDIPLRTSNPPSFDRGSYPLRWTEDYTNRVIIANTSSKRLGYRAIITAGTDIYVLSKGYLDPNSTALFDVDKLRREGTPDVNGHKLPQDAPYGKFLWSELSDGKNSGLLGRTSLASITNHRRSSFSCGETCDEVVDVFPFVTVPSQINYQSSASAALTERYQSANQPLYYYPYLYSNFVAQNSPYVSQDYSIINLDGDPSDQYSLRETAVDVGTAYLGYTVLDYFFVYEPAAAECDEDLDEYGDGGQTETKPTVEIQDFGQPYNLTTGSSVNITAIGQPANGTFTWTTSNAGVASVSSGAATTQVSAISPGTANVLVKYTVNQKDSDPDGRVIHVSDPAYVTNFRQTSGGPAGGGTLQFVYSWDSSTGNLSDLSQCTVREVVNYPAGSFNSPPYAPANIQNPTYGSVSGTAGSVTDNNAPGNGFQQPYVADSFTATQKFQFSCSNYQSGNWTDLLTNISITRTVSYNSGASTWKYTIAKSGQTATVDPLP